MAGAGSSSCSAAAAPIAMTTVVGFYGLDVYSLYPSVDEVLRYLDAADPAAASRVRAHYRCFDRWRPSTHDYGESTRGGTTCERQAGEALRELEALFSALRNAHAVANAESYFRTAYLGT